LQKLAKKRNSQKNRLILVWQTQIWQTFFVILFRISGIFFLSQSFSGNFGQNIFFFLKKAKIFFFLGPKTAKYLIFWPKCQNIFFSGKSAKIFEKIFYILKTKMSVSIDDTGILFYK